MQLLVREIHPNEVEQEVTQRDQFNTDSVGLVETLVRETLQNSMDGASTAGKAATVCARFDVLDAPEGMRDFWTDLLSPLEPHLRASGLSVDQLDFGAPRLLVIEDFGTTGLLGSVTQKDSMNFSDFWRRTGRSHKGGQQGGRWGLGKLVLTSCSEIRTFFGLTVQESDPTRTPCVMGQAVLKTHVAGEPPREYAPHAFFANSGISGLQVPDSDPAFVASFRAATSMTRGNEPGLSIAVPFANREVTTDSILPFILRNWFFPILTGRLAVQLGDMTLDQSSFSGIALSKGGTAFSDGRLLDFIGTLHKAREAPPEVTLPHDWFDKRIVGALSDSQLTLLREHYSAGKLVSLRVPLSLRPRNGGTMATFVDIYLQQNADASLGEALFVRGAITIPGEARKFRGRNCFAAMIAQDPPVASFLGDAEGPAHTTWSGTAEKVRERWKAAGDRLREIREALNMLFEAVSNLENHKDDNALIDTFYVNTAGASRTPREKRRVIREVPVPPIPPARPAYRIGKLKGGFVVGGTEDTALPLSIRIRAAYDVLEGNPLKLYSKYDFEFGGREITVEPEGATIMTEGSNELRIDPITTDFRVKVSGFDENRDLFVKAEKIQ